MSAELLHRLRASKVLEPTFPRRVVYNHAEWAALDEDARAHARREGVEAIRRVPDHQAIAELVRSLRGYPPAIPTLADLWQHCPVVPIRHAAGFALRELGTPDARELLAASVEDATDFVSLNLGVRVMFEQDPPTSFERLSPYFDEARLWRPGGAVVPNAILSFFCPSSFLGSRPNWTEPRAPSWLSEDWLRLCARLRKHDLLGRGARAVLRYAEADSVERALAASPLQPPPATVVVGPGDLLARYERGGHVEVWRVLRSHPAIGGDLREEALAVARATMERVRQNVVLLASRLADRGWRALGGDLHARPRPEDRKVMREIEERTGAPLPPSLRAFWEVVGGVDFVWDYHQDVGPPDLGIDLVEADPLCVDPAHVASHVFEQWEESIDSVPIELRDPYNLDLAPDYLHKADISGGAPYGVELPFLGADPLWINEAHDLAFVDYLRLCFQWAGFPRLERDPRGADFARDFGAGLIPF